MMERGQRNDDVRRLQHALIELGYDLPRWGADGDLGAETIDALARFLRAHGAEVADDANQITDEQLALVDEYAAALAGAPLGPSLPSGRFHDLRGNSAQSQIGGRRSWKQVTGIVLHQTACNLGEKPTRWSTVVAHMGVSRAGQVMWMHDFEQIVWHANLFNGYTIGIEMDGEYAGIQGNDHTFWRPKDEPKRQPQTPTAELVAAAQATVRWICEEVGRHGGKIQHLFAHRQSSVDRQSDPGSALWQGVARPLLDDAKLGITDGGSGYTVGTGMAIPESWDPTRTGVKY